MVFGKESVTKLKIKCHIVIKISVKVEGSGWVVKPNPISIFLEFETLPFAFCLVI